MNDTNTNQRLSPQRAIIVYRDRKEYNHSYYLESREIVNKDGKYVFMAPVPLAANVLKTIAQSYIKNNAVKMSFNGLIDQHILHASNKLGKTVVIWYRPAMKRNLNFSASLKIKGDIGVHIPATLYLVVNTTLYIYALMNSDRPDLKTKLYNAPFFNIYKDGNVCMGSAKVGQKQRTFDKEAERFERAFYMAEQNGGNVENKCKTDLSKLWRQLVAKKISFPSKEELIQHPKFKTLADLINSLAGNNSNDHDQED